MITHCCYCLAARYCLTLQARILEWIAISFSRESPNPGSELTSPTLAGEFFTTEPINYKYYNTHTHTHTHTHICLTQSRLTLCHPMDCSLPGSSVHGILQTRLLGWVTMPSSRGPSWSRDWTQVSRITGRFFTIWATRDTWAPEQGGSGEEIPAHFSHLLWQNQKPASEDAHSGTFLKGQLLGLRTHGGDPAGQCWSSSCLVLERR